MQIRCKRCQGSAMRWDDLYGYNINSSLEFRVESNILVNINDGRVRKLACTNVKLLQFLIEKSISGGLATDNEIALNIFENRGLKSSPSRIRGAVRSLKNVFIELGCQPNFIYRVDRKGYFMYFNKIDILIAFKIGMESPYDLGLFKERNGYKCDKGFG